MSLFRWHAVLGLVVLLADAPAVQAQQQFTPRIGYVYPAGGRQGTTFQVTIGGQFLDGNADAFVSGAGVRAAVVEYVKPLTQQQVNMLREKLKELQDKRAAAFPGIGNLLVKPASQPSTRPAWTAEDAKMIAEIRAKLATFNRNANPAIAETVTFQVTVSPDAEPGRREIRLRTPLGLTNPLAFCVGELPEFSKQPAKFTNELARPLADLRNRTGPGTAALAPDPTITLPTIVNGQIMPGAVDRFRFQARKGQRLVVAAGARELIPYLPDAVPGWFQATLALYDAKGNELAYADHFQCRPDPVLYYEVPMDGQYVVEIRDAIYRGREDFVYRIALGELPFVTSIFPLGGQAGAQTTVEVRGWNLPVARMTVDDRDKGPGIRPLSVGKDGLISNHVPFAVDTLPECLEQGPSNQPGGAQPVMPPVIVNGRIEKPGEWDVFCFQGRAGSEIVAEVCARRLGSPLDSVLKLTDANGQLLAFNDDHEDKGSGLSTHHADSWLCATLPADGTYYLHLGDTQHKGGPEYGYRLRISPPRPDFELRVAPSGINVRGGASVPITVYALRKDGFTGEIALVLKDSPGGFTLSGARIPAQQDQVRLTLTAPPTPLKDPLSLSLEGSATIQGRQVVRPAVPAEDMMQAFAYRHLVPAQDLKVAVSGRIGGRASARVLSQTPVKIPAGGTARVQVAVPTGMFMGEIQLELSDPPEGIDIQKVSPSPRGTEIVLHSDAAKVKPGLKGNLIVSAFTERTPAAGDDKAKAVRRRIPLGTLPAIPFEVVAK
jgi:hypothetical protein